MSEPKRGDEPTTSTASMEGGAFERAPVALALVEHGGRIRSANARFRALTGHTAEALRAMRLDDLLPPEEQARGGARLRALLEGGLASPSVEVRCRRADGVSRRFLWRGPDPGAAEGEPVVLSLEDVTEAHARETAMHAISSSLERVTDGFVAMDRDWRYVYLNTQGARLLGRTPEQLLGKHIWTEFPDGVGQPFHRAYERAMAEQVPITLEDYYPPFGRWFENRIYPSPEGISIYFHDITDRVMDRERMARLAADLREERLWLEALLDQLPTPLVLVQPETGRVLFANEVAVRSVGALLMGAEAGSGGVLAGSWSDALGHRLSPEELPQARVARGERLENLLLAWDAPTGPQWWLCNSAFLPAQSGHAATCVLAFQDVASLKRVEAELSRAVHDRDEFLAIASHELRTPLTGLTLQVQSLVRNLQVGAQRGLTPEQLPAKAESLLRGLARLTKLVHELLDISSIRGGRLVLEREDVDASVLVRDVLGRLGAELSRAHCPLALHVEPDVSGRWDRLRLEQVVTNLVTNAAKYGPGKPIEVSLEARGSRALLTVRDHGIGIALEDQARIFEPFERAVSSRHYGGFGLGLWIVRQIVESMGGGIRVESAPGQGSTFRVELEREEASRGWAAREEAARAH